MFARGSAGIIALPFVICVVFLYLEIWWIAGLFLIAFCIMLVFFRDPERDVGPGIVSAADGVVDFVREHREWLVISVFMNVHNVHVNRAPLDGKIMRVKKKKGGRWPAFMERSSQNAKASIEMQTGIGRVMVELITGIFAWRVVPYVRNGKSVRKGSRVGLIRFGSRVNVWLPANKVDCLLIEGQKVWAGVTTIAEVKDEVA